MRYLPLTEADRREMLSVIGAKSVDELFKDVPASARLGAKVAGLPDHLGELEVERAFQAYAAKNVSPAAAPFFIGAGAYRHHVPATVDYMIQRGEFLTSYTPYQPEITQGTLQYLFEFQTQVTLLTGMEVANASMYDGSTGTSEAVLMANRITRRQGADLRRAPSAVSQHRRDDGQVGGLRGPALRAGRRGARGPDRRRRQGDFLRRRAESELLWPCP
jgi:glycine dehydrogenase subunit 1